MSITCPTPQLQRLLVSPNGMHGTKVRPLDARNPLHVSWTDLTDLNDEAFELEVNGRQRAALATAGA